MSSDIKFILFLLITLIGPYTYFTLFEEQLPEEANWSYDMHLNYFEDSLNKINNPDIVFFGTSRTMNNVRTDILNEYFKNEKTNIETHNLGINWFGHGLQYHLIKRWLSYKKPKMVVIETPMLYRYYAHPHYAKLISPTENTKMFSEAAMHTIKPSLIFSPRIIYQNIASHFNFPTQKLTSDRANHSGHVRVDMTPERNKLLASKMTKVLARGQQKPPETHPLKQKYREFLYSQHLYFLKEIKNICQENNIIFIQLVLPKVRLNQVDPYLSSIYKNNGTLIIPPAEVIQHPEFWNDFSHMNLQGAEALSLWLAPELNKFMNSKTP